MGLIWVRRLVAIAVTAASSAMTLPVLPARAATATTPGTSTRFVAQADARAEAVWPRTNFGTRTTLRADGFPEAHSYVRFTVAGVAAPVTQVKVRLYAVAGGGTVDGPALYTTDADWSETRITWGTRPPRTSGVIADVAGVRSDSWVEYDVTQVVKGNGTYSFAVVPTSSDGANFSAREGGRPPELVVTPPPPPPPSPPGQPPVLVGAGDIADCAGPGDEATAALLDKTPGTVFTVGDNAYPNGTSTDFANCYEPGWGRHKARTRPAAGNHEYYTPGAKAYFDYFGAAAGDPAKGYYGYDLGTWRIIVLNSECSEVGGCQQGSPQEQWLRRELEANAAKNVLAYWHRPRFNCGTHPSDASMDAFWQALYGHGADVVLAGHDHSYQRFAPQDPSGKADNQYGVRQFVVGTGGRSHYASCAMPNTEVHNGDTYGLLKLTLDTSSYSWEFLPEAGRTFTDRGSSPTHAPPPPLRQVRFAAGADAGTEASSADTNYGTAITMRADDDPGAHSYLRFSVEGLPAPVAKAHVRVYTVAGDETRDGPALYAADANWSETELTWNTRPTTTGGVLGDVGAVAGESWVDYDVTSLVTANATYGFALAPTSPDGITFSTREGTRPPELVVTLAQSGG